jgi:hypothetical protein
LAILGAAACLTAAEATADALVSGRVLDENNTPVVGARITLRSTASAALQLTAASDVTGAFSIQILPGSYLLGAERAGFFSIRDRMIEVTDTPEELDIVLNHVRELIESIDVVAPAAPVDVQSTSYERRVTGSQILDIPYPATRSFRNALRLLPGVAQDQKGGLHFDGGLENQVYFSLDGFNVGDPVTGRFNTRLSVDSVRSVTWSSGRYSPEFGKGSAGAMAIETITGDDRFRYSATNMLPGVDTRGGLHIGTWAPRFTVSGPVHRGRAWFANSLEAEYSQKVLTDIPQGPDRTTSVRGGNLLRGQVNLTAANILSVSVLANLESSPRSGLGPLDPLSTTIDRRGHQVFVSVKDQIYFSRGALVEAGFARNRTRFRARPQGAEFYVITPDGRGGNYFADSTQTGARDQVIANVFLPPFYLAGQHRIKAGIDLDRNAYGQRTFRTGYEQWGAAGRLLSRTTFAGSGAFDIESTEASSYVVDAWRLRPNLVLEYGLRQDWDSLVEQAVISPRVAVSWAPAVMERTQFSAGFAVVYDASSLAVFARPLDQYSITTTFGPDGNVIGSADANRFVNPGLGLRPPRYRNWSFGVEHSLTPSVRLSAGLLSRRGSDGFAYAGRRSGGEDILELANLRRDVYDAASATLQHSFGKRYEWFLSYTRSRALSTAVIDINVDQPLRVIDNFGRLSWDMPNRVLGWGYLPAWNPKWAIAWLLDWRSGFPFSVQRESGEVVGAVNSHRFPDNFDLNVHLERRVRWRSYHFALRAGFNNVTNHLNATSVNNTIGSENFLKYYGREGRHLVFRLRWLGR